MLSQKRGKIRRTEIFGGEESRRAVRSQAKLVMPLQRSKGGGKASVESEISTDLGHRVGRGNAPKNEDARKLLGHL